MNVKSATARKVLIVASEIAPLAKVGGLADVTAALTKEMSRAGCDVRVVMPLYRGLRERYELEPDGVFPVRVGAGEASTRLWRMDYPGSTGAVFCVENDAFYDRAFIYNDPHAEYTDNGQRFVFLSRAALDACLHWRWYPDVIHCHDWPTGIVPVYLNTVERLTPLGRAASVFTIHNLAHQGIFDRSLLDYARIPDSVFRPDGLECFGMVNLMKGGLYHSTKLTTVSPSYSREIQTAEYGCGLEHVLHFRAADLIGILNGIDSEVWNPLTDTLIPQRYGRDDMAGKAVCKRVLQEQTGLDVDPNVPVFSAVARLYEQKGLDLLAAGGDRIIDSMAVQVVVLGAGDPALEARFRELEARYPGRFSLRQGYDESLAHLLEAGADFFLMPSRFEPCGLNQMYSMAYGTPPIVRATGGLIDTVEQYVEGTSRGTGFIFEDAEEEALYFTIGWACSTWYDRPNEYAMLQRNGMARDFSWGRAVARYLEVYSWACDARAGTF